MRRRLALGLIVIASLGQAACGSDQSAESRPVSDAVQDHLAYLAPESSLVVAFDLRYEEENWEHLRAIVDRLLTEAREDGRDVPANAEAALGQLARLWKLDFEEDVRPLLDGYLVVGLTAEPGSGPDSELPDSPVIVVYRTVEGELRPAVEKTLDGTPLRPLRGRDDVLVTDDGFAVVGGDTLVAAATTEQVTAAIERADAGRGFPADLMGAAERGAGIDDPLLLATGTPDLARSFVAAENLERARTEVPYLAALEQIDLALDVGEEAVEARGQLVTTGAELGPDDLPLGPARELELPIAEGAIAGGSRDQSRITTFAASVVRSAFADSDFVAAVEETERELGIRFEEEVLRQFDCPSVSVFEPEPDAPLGAAGRFAARSCLRDPERMRELLPKLAPRLPGILRAMRGLGGEGLLGLLMVAPDAPLSPGALLLQIGVEPLGGGAPEEQLYEVSGLRETESGEPAFPGPDRVVFGMIGDDFVVGSDRQAARDAAALETQPATEQAASALRVPPQTLAGLFGSREGAELLGRTFGDIEIGFSAEPSATRATARMPLR